MFEGTERSVPCTSGQQTDALRLQVRELPKRDGGSVLIALSSVVEDHIQDDLDAAPVALLHERLELVHNVHTGAAGRRGCAVPGHGRKEAHG